MEKQYTAESLKRMIADLEKKQVQEGRQLKEELDKTIKNFSPANILKSLLKEFYSSESLLDELINTAVSVTSGYLTKKMVIGRSKNQVLRLIGMALQFGMTTVIAKKFHQIKENINQFISHFFADKKEQSVTETEAEKESTKAEAESDSPVETESTSESDVENKTGKE